MANDEQREKVIAEIANLLRRNQFSVEFKVVKKPKGVKIIYEVTKDMMDKMMQAQNQKNKENEK